MRRIQGKTEIIGDDTTEIPSQPKNELHPQVSPNESDTTPSTEEAIGATARLVHPMVTRLKSGAIQPKNVFASLTKMGDTAFPSNANEAFEIPHWNKAMKSEYDPLLRNDTWYLVPHADQNLVDSKWIFN